jgi:hypothetical protein
MSKIQLPSYFVQSEDGEVLILSVVKLAQVFNISAHGYTTMFQHFIADLKQHGLTYFINERTNQHGIAFEHSDAESIQDNDLLEKYCPFNIKKSISGKLEVGLWRRNWSVKSSHIPLIHIIPKDLDKDFDNLQQNFIRIIEKNQTITFYENQKPKGITPTIWEHILETSNLTTLGEP